MPKRILVSALSDETRVAIVDGNTLTHLQIENNLRERQKGNIYKARVYKVEPSFQAAFVDYGADKHGFLPVSEIHPKYVKLKNGDEAHSIQDMIREGQELVVQVVREEIGHKGATLSTFISLPGRYLVLMPESSKTGISRRLDEAERTRLRELIDSEKLPEGYGVIVRTAGSDQTRKELNRDLQNLLRLAKSIDERAQRKGPLLLHRDQNLAIRFIRDYLTTDVEAILIDEPQLCEEVEEFIGSIMPRKRSIVKRYTKDIPMFSNYQLEQQIETAFSRQVQLPSGGSIVIDHTEALVAIDVNSGRVKERDIEDTAALTNLEAAREAARQVMLRDLGGLIVIDFIDMREKNNIRKLEQEIKNVFKADKARTKFSRLSEFGLMEISRQRMGATLNSGNFQTCPECSGQGRVWAPTSRAINVLRKLKELVARNRATTLRVQLPLDVANVLLNKHRAELVAIEADHGVTIEIFGTVGIVAPEHEIEIVSNRQNDGAEGPKEGRRSDSGQQRSRGDRRNRPPETETPRAGQKKGRDERAASKSSEQADPADDSKTADSDGQRGRGRQRSRSAEIAGSAGAGQRESGRASAGDAEGPADHVDDGDRSAEHPSSAADEVARSERTARRRRGRRGGRGRRSGSRANQPQSETAADTDGPAPEAADAPPPRPVTRDASESRPAPRPQQKNPSSAQITAAHAMAPQEMGEGFFSRLFRRSRKKDAD